MITVESGKIRPRFMGLKTALHPSIIFFGVIYTTHSVCLPLFVFLENAQPIAPTACKGGERYTTTTAKTEKQHEGNRRGFFNPSS